MCTSADMIETIEKRETHIQRKIDNEITQAKKFSAAGKKREALQCIKRKKMYEKQLEQIRCASAAVAFCRDCSVSATIACSSDSERSPPL